MKAQLFRNARLIDPAQGLNEIGGLMVKEGKVAWIGAASQKPPENGYSVVEGEGLVLCPGFIDLHCHLREPGFEDKETIASGSRAAARGGFTTICCMPNTNPAIDNRAVADFIREKASREAVVRILPIGAITRERKGEGLSEMGELAQAGVVGFSDDGDSVKNSRLLRQAMEYSLNFDLPIMEHCEDKTLVGSGQMNEGIIATRLGLAGMPAAAEESMVARDIALAEMTGARLHICHLSTRGALEQVRAAKKKGVRVTAEVTPHHLTLSEEAVMGYDTSTKVNPPLRSRQDVEALVGGLLDGTIDAIATDHAPHTQVEKTVEFAAAPFGISGLETALGSLMGLVQAGKLDLQLLVAKLTSGPAAIISSAAGTLKPGSPADLVLINPELEWTVDPACFASLGKNTPLAGHKMKGKVVMTLCGGNRVFEDRNDER